MGPVSSEFGLRFTVPVLELGESQSVDFTNPDLAEVVAGANEIWFGRVAAVFVAALWWSVRLGSIEWSSGCVC